MKQVAFSLLWLAIFLTPLSLFGQAKREALVETAFVELPGIIRFLTQSYEFDQKLSVEERQQLHRLFGVTETIAHHRAFGDSIPGGPQIPKVNFSSDQKIFELTAGQPERSAVTTAILTDPIWFNLRILNSSSFDGSYLDILQILFHEVGHKLGAAKNQTAMDSLGSKFVQFIKPYYQHALLDGRIKLEILSIPTKVSRTSFGEPSYPNILMQENGFVISHRVDYHRVAGAVSQFTSSEQGSGNISEQILLRIVSLDGEAGAARALSFETRLQIEATSQIVFMDPSMGMRAVGPSVGGSQVIIPQAKFYSLVEPGIANMNFRTSIGRPDPKWGIPQTLYLQEGTWNYQDLSGQFRVTSAQNDRSQVRIEISSPEKIKSIFLRLESNDGEMLIPANASKTSGKYVFALPADLASSTGEIRFSDVVINGVGTIPLPEIGKISVPTSAKKLSLKTLEIFDGQKWIPYEADKITTLPEGPLKLRLQTEGDADLKQIKLVWNKGSALYWSKPDQIFGTHSQTVQEVISNFTKVSENTYEFTATEVMEIEKLKTAEKVVGSFDSGKRFLKEVSMTSSNLGRSHWRFSPHLKIYNREFIQVKPKPKMVSCNKIH